MSSDDASALDYPRSDAEKTTYLQAGNRILFPPFPSTGQADPALEARRIKSGLFEEWARASNSVVSVPLTIENAIIEGPLSLKYITFKGEVSVINCHFSGPLDLSFAVFERSVHLDHSCFEKDAVFSACHAKSDFIISGVKFEGAVVFTRFLADQAFIARGACFESQVTFVQAKLKSAEFSPWLSTDGSPEIRQTTFNGDADFSYADIDGPSYFEGTLFAREVRFNRTQIRGAAYFSCYDDERAPKSLVSFARTCFKGYTSFSHAQIDGSAYFLGVEFGGSASFERAVIGGHAIFQTLPGDDRRPSICVTFKKDASFLAAQIGANAEFDGACFEGEAVFERVTVNRNAVFRSFLLDGNIVRATFIGSTTFLGAKIGGSAEFFGASFSAGASFASIQVDGNALFQHTFDDDEVGSVCFSGAVDFTDSHFKQQACFPRVCFRDAVDFTNIEVEGVIQFSETCFEGETKFTSAHLKSQANFERARFLESVDFRDLKVEGAAFFTGAEFTKDTILTAARFKSLHFTDTKFRKAQISGRSIFRRREAGNLDLRGLNYEQIECDAKALMASLGPYDRQPYTVLEKVIRSTGQDREADNVYYQARDQEGLQLWEKIFVDREFKHLPKAISNYFQKAVFRFGIRPYRLIAYCVLVLSLGFYVFGHEGAIMHKDKRDRAAQDDAALMISSGEAFNVSLRQFIPIVEIPIAGDYVPSDRPAPGPMGKVGLSFAGYATVHRLFGFLLIPLGLASLTGLIQRRKPQ